MVPTKIEKNTPIQLKNKLKKKFPRLLCKGEPIYSSGLEQIDNNNSTPLEASRGI